MDVIDSKLNNFRNVRARAKAEKIKKMNDKILIRDLPMVYGLFAIGVSSN